MSSSINMTELQRGDKAIIFSIASEDTKYLHKLMVFGLMAGTQFELLQKIPCYVLQIGYMQLAVDKKMAQNIIVVRK